MASRHKNPGRFKNDNFLKTIYKISALFQLSSEIKKGAAQSLTAYGWYSSKDTSQHVCIYETVKNRVHILPLISKLISVDFSWNYPKKRFRCNLFQVASKVLNKHGGTGQIWTGEWRFCRPLPYHLATVPYEIRNAPRSLSFSGAGDEARTRYLHLGKVALYRMSYARIWCRPSESNRFDP